MGQRLDDPDYLRAEQYRTDANLAARVDLHRRFSTNEYGWFRWVLDHLDMPNGSRVLELGSGAGDLWLDNRDRVPRSWEVTLSDFSPGMLDAARDRLGDAAPRFTFRVVDAQAIPADAAAFDAVIANHMLYHIPDRPRALREVRRVLRPGGRCFATTNGRRHLWELEELVRAGTSGAKRENAAAAFGLENGAEQLQPWFAKVVRDDYSDGLAVTEVEPLVAYVLSTAGRDVLDPARIDHIRRAIAERIGRSGTFLVTKALGLFSCVVRE